MAVSADQKPNESPAVRTSRPEDGGEARDVKDRLTGRAMESANRRKDEATHVARSTSSALRSAADDLDRGSDAPDWLTSGFRTAADKLSAMAGSIERKDARDIVNEVSRFARSHPVIFLAGAAATGFAAARVFRAGVDLSADEQHPRQDDNDVPSSGSGSNASPRKSRKTSQ